MDDFDRPVCVHRFVDPIPANSDSLVRLEAVSPTELQACGRGLLLSWGVVPSPFGLCSIAWSERGICHLAFRDAGSGIPDELLATWPHAEFQQHEREARSLGKRIFREGRMDSEPLNVFVRATPFQFKVWSTLLRIPEGRVASYRTVACAVGNPKAARAVGAACGANPVAYLIPCHRVIRETGAERGYRWGDARKRVLLARERSRLVLAPSEKQNRRNDECTDF